GGLSTPICGRHAERELRGAPEHCAQDAVGHANVPRTEHRDEREDLLGLFGRHGALVAGVGEVAQGNPGWHRYAVETVEGGRRLATLDLADELPAEPGLLCRVDSG